MRSPVAVAAMMALALFAAEVRAAPLVLETSPVALNGEDDAVDRVGDLRFLGGLELRSSDRRFGGLSGLLVSPDGRRLDLVADVGHWVRMWPRYSADGRLVGIASAEIGPLSGPDGRLVQGKTEADAESLSRVADGVAVSFEHHHRIWVYRGEQNPFLARPREIAAPAALQRADPNRGLEAFATLRDGRLGVIAEDFPSDTPVTYGWIREKQQWHRFAYRRTGLFRPTAAAVLPDGDLLVLERRFTILGGVATRLARVPLAALQSGATVRSREIARLEPPLITENFEGVDVRRDEWGRIVVYLVADDNFNPFQRTLLLLFALDEP